MHDSAFRSQVTLEVEPEPVALVVALTLARSSWREERAEEA